MPTDTLIVAGSMIGTGGVIGTDSMIGEAVNDCTDDDDSSGCGGSISDDCRLRVVMMSMLMIDSSMVVVDGVGDAGGSNKVGGTTHPPLVPSWPFRPAIRQLYSD